MGTMSNEKNKTFIFAAVCFGLTLVFGLLMWICHVKGYDNSAFPLALMLTPAAGVSAGMLADRGGSRKLPKAFLVTVMITALACALWALLSVLLSACSSAATLAEGAAAGAFTYKNVSSCIIIAGSFAGIVFCFKASEEQREDAGLNPKNIRSAVKLIILFILLYLLRTGLTLAAEGILAGDPLSGFSGFAGDIKDPSVWKNLALLPVSFIETYIVFFGEEYGWRYFLQPRLGKRLGKRTGILVLGVIWGIWHLPLDLFYYTQTTPLQMVAAQLIICIACSVFFGYAYLKTDNIWVPVIMHFLNNNLLAPLSEQGGQTAGGTVLSWNDVLISLAVNAVVFMPFIFSRIFDSGECRKRAWDSSEK